MLSRVANSIYWMNRYIERAENTARLIDVNLNLTLDRTGIKGGQWGPLIDITSDEALFAARYEKTTRSNVIEFLTLDLEYPNSIASCIAAARENARTVRDVITSDMWEQINALHIMIRQAAVENAYLENPHRFYTQVKLACQLFDAVTDGTMSHGTGWEFARLGRMIERADKTSRILDVKYFLLLPRPEDVGTAVDVVQWAALLKSAGALNMYRQAYGAITPANVVRFLVLDLDFPRSLTFCLNYADDALHNIIGHHTTPATHEATRQVGRLRSELRFGDADEIIERGLHEYLDSFQKSLNQIGVTIDEAFFQPHAHA